MTNTIMKTLCVTTALAVVSTGMAQAQAVDMDALIAAAKAEGTLTTIALPRD